MTENQMITMSSSPKLKKGYAEQNSFDQTRQLLLHEWVNLAEEIHKRKAVENPFEQHFLTLIAELPITQQILFKSLTKSIAKMNASSRTNTQSHTLLCSESDNLNALQLILPESLKLKPTHDEILLKLERCFKNKPFTYQEVGMLLKCSHSSVKRKLQPLIVFRKLSKEKSKTFNRTLLHITGIAPQKPSIHQEMMTDWEDFVGYENLNYRT